MASPQFDRTRLLLSLAAVLVIVSASGCYDSNKDYGTSPSQTGNPAFDSGNLATNASYQRAFADSGAFRYHCDLHACMAHGTVTVTAGAADSALVTIATPGGGCPGGYTPLAVAVRPGGVVRWVNQSVTHTVTSD